MVLAGGLKRDGSGCCVVVRDAAAIGYSAALPGQLARHQGWTQGSPPLMPAGSCPSGTITETRTGAEKERVACVALRSLPSP